VTLVNVPISGAAFRWEALFHDSERQSPQDLVLDFDSGHRVWIMAAEWRCGDWHGGGMDHVTVVFDPAVAKVLGRRP
jgi:hypothetical protein